MVDDILFGLLYGFGKASDPTAHGPKFFIEMLGHFYFRGVRHKNWRLPLCEFRPDGHRSADQVVHIRPAAARIQDASCGEQYIVVDEHRAMVHLDHQIVAVAMQEVAGQPCALAHPVDPDAAPVRTAVNMILTDNDIQRSM